MWSPYSEGMDLLRAYVPAFCLLCFVIGARFLAHIPFGHLTRDTTAVLNAPFYIGLVSNIGMLLWSSCAGICAFTAALLRGNDEDREMQLFLLASCAITSFLLFDDLFLFHEDFCAKSLHIPETVTFAAYGAAISVYFIRFRTTILKTEFILLAIALVFFGLSIIVDEILPGRLRAQFLLEDGFKFLGIVSWLAYFARVCTDHVKNAASYQRGGLGTQTGT